MIDRDRILVRDLRAIYALAAKDADEASGMTAGEPATASPTAGVTGALAPTAPGSSPLFPAVGGHLLGAMDDAIASDGRPTVAGPLFDSGEFRDTAHWREG